MFKFLIKYWEDGYNYIFNAEDDGFRAFMFISLSSLVSLCIIFYFILSKLYDNIFIVN